MYEIHFLALDAFCLLLLYEKLFHATEVLNLRLEDVFKKINHSPAAKGGTSKKEKKQLEVISRNNLLLCTVIYSLYNFFLICGE